MVTKQQQLEWLAKEFDVWPGFGGVPIRMSSVATGEVNNGLGVAHCIRMEEWQQERDKMQKQAAQPTPDNSWHERGEFPPAGCECEVLHRGKWIKTVIIGMSPYKSCVYSLIGSGSDYAYDGIANSHFFRPIRTEREKAIDAACAAVCKAGPYDHERELIGKLYDAGMLK